MDTVTFGGRSYTLDDNRFLDPPGQWDEHFARGMARALGIVGDLTRKHWKIIHYLREKFLDENTVPVMVTACADNEIRLNEFKALFPMGYHRGACRIAGINYRFMYNTNYWLTYETGPPLRGLQDRYKLDEQGFLADFDDWDEDFAYFIRARLKRPGELTHEQKTVINYLRDFFQIYGNIPTLQETCTVTRLSLKAFHTLFPNGYRRGACRMAGLPFYP